MYRMRVAPARSWSRHLISLPRLNELSGDARGENGDETKQKAKAAGWTEERIGQLAEYYDNQTEDEQVAEQEAALQAEGHTVMVVPTELVPEILKLITKKRTA